LSTCTILSNCGRFRFSLFAVKVKGYSKRSFRSASVTTLEKLTDFKDFLYLFYYLCTLFFEILIIQHHGNSFDHYLWVLDFVLKRALQQGQRKPETVIKILHRVHLFCPYPYLEPFGIFSPLRPSHTPLQTYPIMIWLPQMICDSKGSWSILKLVLDHRECNIF